MKEGVGRETTDQVQVGDLRQVGAGRRGQRSRSTTRLARLIQEQILSASCSSTLL